MAEVGWDEVTYLTKRNPKAGEMRSQQAVQAARREGKTVDTSKKFSAGQNRQHMSSKDTAKLDRETEELHHERVSLDVGRIIQKGRMDKKMSQKDLATVVYDTLGSVQTGCPTLVLVPSLNKALPNEIGHSALLLKKINEKPSVINDYEAGRAIPNNQIMGKIERAIGLKLRGKDKGLPLGGGKK